MNLFTHKGKEGGELRKGGEKSKVKDPYRSGILAGRPSITLRTRLEGRVVGVLNRRIEKLGLELIHPKTRCVKKFEVHEVLLTDEREASPGTKVNHVASIAFIEFSTGGVLVQGDKVTIGNRDIGRIAGFDETHYPNHINIVLKGPKRITGIEWGIVGGAKVAFRD